MLFLSLFKRIKHLVLVLKCYSCREVGVEDLKAVFNTIDPTLDSETLYCYLSTAFQTKELHKHTQLLDTEVALQRLSTANVNRAGPRPQLD